MIRRQKMPKKNQHAVLRFLEIALVTLLVTTACTDANNNSSGRRFWHNPFFSTRVVNPWPAFRNDHKNSGRSTIVPRYNGTTPWQFQTKKGIFSTPVIDHQERVYVGSADKTFYAIDAAGKLLWTFPTQEVIDSAALLTHRGNDLFITIPSGDGFLYHLSTDPSIKDPADRIQWKFDSKKHPSSRQIGYNWFEGNVVQGLDGTLYAGSTNWTFYAIDPATGGLRWSLEAGNMNWGAAAFSDSGDIYWTSLDSKIRRTSPRGKILWEKSTWGFVTASVALDENENAYVGASDNAFYALDKEGTTKWYFKANDHIYGSAALDVDANNRTNAIYFTSADGHLYRLNTAGGLVWKFDAHDVIRSSPVIGPKPSGEKGSIIYFGAANGKLYAVNSEGTLRWSFDTTPFGDPEIEDRNDLNASPALGKNGIYVAGEHGFIWHVPYDYPLAHPTDPKVALVPQSTSDTKEMRFATPGGSRLDGDPKEPISYTQALTCELLVRKDGTRIDAGIETGVMEGFRTSDIVKIHPPTEVRIEKSADGHFLYVRPVDFWKPDTTYSIDFNGYYVWGGLSFGAVETSLGSQSDSFADKISFTTSSPSRETFPLQLQQSQNGAFAMRRLAIPYPSMITSLNQIGFDSYHLIVGLVDISAPNSPEGRLVLWGIGAITNEKGELIVDKSTDFLLPMAGTYQNESFVVRNQGSVFNIANIRIPLDLELRAQFRPDMTSKGASLYGEVPVWSDWVYGPLLAAAGLINKSGKMPFAGTFLTNALPSGHHANQRPAGLEITKITYAAPGWFRDGYINVKFNGTTNYLAGEHITSLLLIDRDLGEPYYIDYKSNTKELVEANGALSGLKLRLPAGMALGSHVDLVVLTDVFPFHRVSLD